MSVGLAAPGGSPDFSSPALRTLVLFDAPRVAYGLGHELEFLELQLRRTGALVESVSALSVTSNQLHQAAHYVIFCPQPEPRLPTNLLQQLVDSRRPVWWVGHGIAGLTVLPPGVARSEPLPGASFRLTQVRYRGRLWDIDEAAWIPVRRVDDAASPARVMLSPAEAEGESKSAALCWQDGAWTFFSGVPSSGRLGWLFSEVVLEFYGLSEGQPSRLFLRVDNYQADSDHHEFQRKVDLLAARGRPFAVSVTPSWKTSPTGAVMNLDSTPEFLEGLRYAQARGGRLLMRGCRRDGDRAEFWDEELDRPVEKPAAATRREIEEGVALMLKHGLLPLGWQTPRDAAARSVQREVARVFATSVERPQLSDLTQRETALLSCVTFDREGRRIVPENLGFIPGGTNASALALSQARMRTNAAFLSSLRGTVAGAYFHAYLPQEKLAELLDLFEPLKKPFLDLVELDHWVHVPGRLLLTGRAERTVKLAGGVLTWRAFDRAGRPLLTEQEFALPGERLLKRKGKGDYELFEFTEVNP